MNQTKSRLQPSSDKIHMKIRSTKKQSKVNNHVMEEFLFFLSEPCHGRMVDGILFMQSLLTNQKNRKKKKRKKRKVDGNPPNILDALEWI